MNVSWSGVRAWALYVIFGADLCHSTVPELQYQHWEDHFSKIRDMPSPHFGYMFLDDMNYMNPFWSGARAWALYVKFGADLCHSTVPLLQYHHWEGHFSKIRDMPSPHF